MSVCMHSDEVTCPACRGVLYRKKPVVIEAVQFNGSSTMAGQIESWMQGGSPPVAGGIHTRDFMPMSIETLEGVMRVGPGDYVIKGVQGEFYPCKADIFEQTYEPVDKLGA